MKRPLLIAVGLAAIALLLMLSHHASPTDDGHQATNSQAPNALSGETIDSYKQRLGASQSPEIDPNSRIVVYVYPISKNKKCVSLATGLLSWEAEHPILTAYEFVSGHRQEVIYRPYTMKTEGTPFDLPLIELPPPGASVNLDYSMYWAPNRKLAEAAQADGFKLIDVESLQNPEEFLQQNTQIRYHFGSRWGHLDSLDRQIFVPFKGQAQDACDDLYVDPWRHQWDPYVFPGARVLRKTRIGLDLSAASPSEDVISFYKQRFPDAYIDSQAGPGVTQINLHRNNLTVYVMEKACSGCTLTQISLTGDFD
jgi:hypothetical protein